MCRAEADQGGDLKMKQQAQLKGEDSGFWRQMEPDWKPSFTTYYLGHLGKSLNLSEPLCPRLAMIIFSL